MDRILNPKNDFAFKALFGETPRKDTLISFLNTIFEGVQEKIEDVEFLPLHQKTEIAILRESIVDVLCRDKDGNHWIIEMQCARDSSFIKRAAAYASRVYLNQRTKRNDPSVEDSSAENTSVEQTGLEDSKADAGTTEARTQKGGRINSYAKLKPVIFLAILDYILFPKKKAYLSHHQIIDTETQERDIKDFSFSFLELEKFKKTRIEELETEVEKWAYFFKNAQFMNREEIEKLIKNSPALADAYKALEEGAFTTDELLEYERYEMKADEVATAISDAIKEGRTEGIKEGREEGLAEGVLRKARETAISMLADELPVDTISKYTNLSTEEIEKLKHKVPGE